MIVAIGTTPAVGRAMVFDRLTLDAVNRARTVEVSAAGKAVNVARVVKLIGHESTCIGIAGGDAGTFVRDDLQSHGVHQHFVKSIHPTRVCVTVIDQATNQTTELVQEAPPGTPEEADQLLAILDGILPVATAIVCSGTISTGIGDDLYARIAERCQKAIQPIQYVIIDAKGDALRLSCKYGVIVKCNASELRDTFGGSQEQAYAACLDAGASALVVSDGTYPTNIVTPGARWSIDTPKIELVSPIGSGDALAAGLAAGLETGWAIQDAARLGVACAAANAMNIRAGFVDPHIVQQLLQQLVAAQISR